MSTDTYHHGDLRESLISMGLKLLNEKGTEAFSIRKLAAMCNVSHAAPYKHFKSKEELIGAILEYVFSQFENTLKEIEETYKEDPEKRIIELGKKYVCFMVENPDYLKILFLNETKFDIILDSDKILSSDYSTFNIFKRCAVECLENKCVPKENQGQDVIAMWSVVHGLAIMLSNKTFVYNGDYLELVENILINNITFEKRD